jgi:hypothetical protein
MSVCWGIGNAATARRSALASYCLACMRCVHTPHEQEPRKLEALSRRTAIDTSWLRGAHRWSIDSSRLDRMGTTTIDQQGRICLLPGGTFFSIKPLSTCGEARRTISSNVACQGPRRARADISVCACFLLFANLSRSLWNSAIEAGRRSCVVAADDTSCCAEQNIALSLGGDLFT